MKEITYIKINSDDDEIHKTEQTKNATEGNQIEVEGKIHTMRKKIIHYYDLSSEDNSKLSGEQAELQKNKKPKNGHGKKELKKKMRKLLSPRK